MFSLEFLKNVDHRLIHWGSMVLAIVTIYLLYLLLPDKLSVVLLDLNRENRELGRFPYSVQNAMWISLYFALVELLIRRIAADTESSQLTRGYLPEEFETVLQASDLPAIYRELRGNPDLNRCFLPRLIDRCILQFQASKSIDQAASLLNTSVEMFLHEVDLNYNLIRYVCWLIPSLGFIGTVVGIGEALAYAGANAQADDLLGHTTGQLAVSFHGTFLALLMASILVFLQNRVQSKEEHALNLGAQYCLDNLINRLYVAK